MRLFFLFLLLPAVAFAQTASDFPSGAQVSGVQATYRQIAVKVDGAPSTATYRAAVWGFEAAADLTSVDTLTTRATPIMAANDGELTLSLERLPVDPLKYRISVAEYDERGVETRRVVFPQISTPDPVQELDRGMIQALVASIQDLTPSEQLAVAKAIRRAVLINRNAQLQQTRQRLSERLVDLEGM